MQRDLDALMDRGSTWGMKFNAKKCNIMRVSRSRKPLQHFYSLGNEILQEVSDAKYLGIQIDNKLDWNKHISTVAARGQSKLAFLNPIRANDPGGGEGFKSPPPPYDLEN